MSVLIQYLFNFLHTTVSYVTLMAPSKLMKNTYSMMNLENGFVCLQAVKVLGISPYSHPLVFPACTHTCSQFTCCLTCYFKKQ